MDDDQMDQLLRQLQAQQPSAPGYLRSRIMANLPEQERPEVAAAVWSKPLWKPAIAACLPLVIGFITGVVSTDVDQQNVSRWYASADPVYADTLGDYEYVED